MKDSKELYRLAEQGDYDAICSRSWRQEQLDWRAPDGRTALMRAAIRGDYQMLGILRNLGADLDLKDTDGRKAVNLAALHGHSVAIAYLIEGGCGG